MVTVLDDGRKQITGDTELKGTQTYPVPFGWANATVCYSHKHEVAEEFHASLKCTDPEITQDELLWDTDRWDDADLDLVVAYLQRCVIQRWG